MVDISNTDLLKEAPQPPNLGELDLYQELLHANNVENIGVCSGSPRIGGGGGRDMSAIATESFVVGVGDRVIRQKRSLPEFFQQVKVDFHKAIAIQKEGTIASQRNVLLLGFLRQPNLRLMLKGRI